MSEKPRPPSKVSAALRDAIGEHFHHGQQFEGVNLTEDEARETADLIDQQAADLAQARRERDEWKGLAENARQNYNAAEGKLDEALQRHAKTERDACMWAERAESVTRELSEAREAHGRQIGLVVTQWTTQERTRERT